MLIAKLMNEEHLRRQAKGLKVSWLVFLSGLLKNLILRASKQKVNPHYPRAFSLSTKRTDSGSPPLGVGI